MGGDRTGSTPAEASAQARSAARRLTTGSASAKRSSASVSRHGRPWPKTVSDGRSAATRRIEARLRSGSSVNSRGGSCRPGRPVDRMAAEEHVAGDQHAVVLAPEREVAGGVAGRLERDEAGVQRVALAQLAVDRDARPGPVLELPAGDDVGRRQRADGAGAQLVGLGRRAPERHAQGGDQLGAGALVVAVAVGDRVRGDRQVGGLDRPQDRAATRSACRRRRSRRPPRRC